MSDDSKASNSVIYPVLVLELREELEKANKDIQVLAEALSDIDIYIRHFPANIAWMKIKGDGKKYKELANKHLEKGDT